MVNRTVSKSNRVVTPVTALDRQRLMEMKEKLGTWTAVSEVLGFRGSSTARKWAVEDSTAFKGKNYPERIKAMHEKIVGTPVAPQATGGAAKRLERVESMMETLIQMLTTDQIVKLNGKPVGDAVASKT